MWRAPLTPHDKFPKLLPSFRLANLNPTIHHDQFGQPLSNKSTLIHLPLPTYVRCQVKELYSYDITTMHCPTCKRTGGLAWSAKVVVVLVGCCSLVGSVFRSRYAYLSSNPPSRYSTNSMVYGTLKDADKFKHMSLVDTQL